jgi:hypothetical protein
MISKGKQYHKNNAKKFQKKTKEKNAREKTREKMKKKTLKLEFLRWFCPRQLLPSRKEEAAFHLGLQKGAWILCGAAGVQSVGLLGLLLALWTCFCPVGLLLALWTWWPTSSSILFLFQH